MAQRPSLDAAGTCVAPAALTNEGVIVDVAACRRLAAVIRAHSIPADHEESSLPGFGAKEIANFYLLLVAICHQTSPRDLLALEGGVGGRRLRGWDYLSAKLEAAARENFEILSPKYWARITTEEVRQLFRDEAFGSRLSDPAGRSVLIRDLGEKMLQRS